MRVARKRKSVKGPAAVATRNSLTRIASIAAAVVILGGALLGLKPSTADQVKASTFMVDMEVEVEINPFMFFFMGAGPRPGKPTFGAKGELPTIKQHSYGTAFKVNGRVITAAHVVALEEGDKLVGITLIAHDGRETKVHVVRTEKETDLAMLEAVDGVPGPSLTLSDVVPRVDDSVTMVGYPALLHEVVTYGKMVGYNARGKSNMALIDVYFGNSGGPVVSNGYVIGMAHFLLQGSRYCGIGTLQDLQNFLMPGRMR